MIIVRPRRHHKDVTYSELEAAMTLSLIDHATLSVFREKTGVADDFGHSFGGSPESVGIRFANIRQPMHLLYRLNLADPAVAVELPGVTWLPLVYGFSVHVYEGELIYRVVNDSEIQLITKLDPNWEPEYPYDGYPMAFTKTSVSFAKQKYNPTVAEDALQWSGILGVEHLPDSEIQRAVKILQNDGTTEWSPEEIRNEHQAPFMQGAPSKSCENPTCTAKVIEHVEEYEQPVVDPYVRKMLGRDTYTAGGYDIREDSMRVFAFHQPTANDDIIWDDPYVQLVFEICDCCKCIRVSNQCT